MNCRIAYNKLKRELGILDAYIELSELSHRDFILNAKNSSNIKDFVKNKSQEHNIIVSANSIEKIKRTFVLTYISLTYNAFEVFFEDFRSEYNLFSNKRFDYELSQEKKSITRFNFLLHNFKELGQKIPKSHIDLYNYFRAIRIRTTHPKSKIKNIESAFNALNIDQETFIAKKKKKEFKIESIPNNFNELTFDDWLMFTKLVKSIANEISKLTIPEPLKLIKHYNLKRLNKYSDFEKKREAVRKNLWSDFMIDKNFNSFEEIYKVM